MTNHLFKKYYFKEIEILETSQKLLIVPAIVKKVPTTVRESKLHRIGWRLIKVYVNNPKLGIIEQDAKLDEDYYEQESNGFRFGNNIEVVVPLQGKSKGVAMAQLVDDDLILTYQRNNGFHEKYDIYDYYESSDLDSFSNNGYYNDQLDMDQQSPEFWDNL